MEIQTLYSKKFHWTAKFIFAAENFIIVITAFIAGYFLNYFLDHSAPIVDGLWAIISGIMVWDVTPKKTISLAKTRFGAACLGAPIGGIYLLVSDFHVMGLGVCVGIASILCYLLNFEKGIKATGVTIAVVLLISTVNPTINPMLNTVLRVFESAIGCIIAIAVSHIPIPPRYRFVN